KTRSEGEAGLQIYVDPIGLQEADKTMDSPVTLNVEGIPLGKALTLMLKQLGLRYRADPEGLVVIDSECCEDAITTDPDVLMLDALSKLRVEVAALRWEVASLRTGGKVSLSTPGMRSRNSGFGGMGAWSRSSGLQSRPVAR